MSNKKPKVLIYDIETVPLQAWVWRCGETRINPGQLVDGHDRYDVICIAWTWLHSGEKGILGWDYKKQNSKKMIKDFTKIMDEADIIIGKNNKRFDDKHMNSMRLWHNLEGRPDLLEKVDDLESQMRRFLYLPSYGLDYLSKQLGFGGKTKMCFADWINIVEKNGVDGQKAYDKMLKYCLKDVMDTKKLWKACEKHCKPKFNRSISSSHDFACATCGSKNTVKNGTRQLGTTKYQTYMCKDHGGYAGKHTITSKNKKLRS